MPLNFDAVVNDLRDHPNTTATEIASRLSCSARTVRRHLATLTESGAVALTPPSPGPRYRLTEQSESDGTP